MLADLLHAPLVVFNDHHSVSGGSQACSGPRAYAAVAHDDRVVSAGVLGGVVRSVGCLGVVPLSLPVRPGGPGKQGGVEEDGDERAGEEDVLGLGREDVEVAAKGNENERELANLRQCRGHHQRHGLGVLEGAHYDVGGGEFAHHYDQHGGEHRERALHQHSRVYEHAHGDKEQHCEGVAQGQGIVGGAVR